MPSAVTFTDGQYVSSEAPAHRSTVYLRDQPPHGSSSVAAMHAWLRARYHDYGTETNKHRPLYRVPSSDVIRSAPGEVRLHASHGFSGTATRAGYPIHAEANPCPTGRIYHAIDLNDIVRLRKDAKLKVRGVDSVSRVPIQTIVECMHPCSDAASAENQNERVDKLVSALRRMLHQAEREQKVRDMKLVCLALALVMSS